MQRSGSRPWGERLLFGLLLTFFAAFTWRMLTMYYSGDDMMNTYFVWVNGLKGLGTQLLALWVPAYRPLGSVVYFYTYKLFGFNPLPLYAFCWTLLLTNVWLGYRFFRELATEPYEAILATAVLLIHPQFEIIYHSAGFLYDDLLYTFYALALWTYVRFRNAGGPIGLGRGLVIWLCCALAMDSKESGVAIPVLMGIYECIFFLPEVWKEKRWLPWLKQVGALHLVLAATCCAYVFGRVAHTPELTSNSAYHVDLRIGLTNLAAYLGYLTNNWVTFTTASAGATVTAALLLAAALRNRKMLFGLTIFLLSIAPLLWITQRGGAVLYVPGIGIALYAGALVVSMANGVGRIKTALPAPRIVALASLASVYLSYHMGMLLPPFPPRDILPHYHLVSDLQRNHPALPPKASILFVSDEFLKGFWDPLLTLRLAYRDRDLGVYRLHSTEDQAPPKGKKDFTAILSWSGGHYEDLDPADFERSIKLNILRYYTVGASTRFSNFDHGAYVVKGIKDFDSREEGRWTEPEVQLKFRAAQVPTEFRARIYIADNVVDSSRTLTVKVNGENIARIMLDKGGERNLRLPLKPTQISANDFTLVDLIVDPPYKNPAGEAFGVVLMSAGFEPVY